MAEDGNSGVIIHVTPPDGSTDTKSPAAALPSHIVLSVHSSLVSTPKSQDSDAISDLIFDQLAEECKKKKPSHDNIAEFVGLAVQLAEKQRINKQPLSGDFKKKAVAKSIARMVTEFVTEESVREYLLSVFIPVALSGLIDSLCNLKVQDAVKMVKFCFC